MTYKIQAQIPFLGMALWPLLSGLVVIQVMPCVPPAIGFHTPSSLVDGLSNLLPFGIVLLCIGVAMSVQDAGAALLALAVAVWLW